jgi:hypothetical protein
VFQPGDQVTITAGGCVQTGGSGSTWKRYVNPTGDDSGPGNGKSLYYGTVTIPGAFFGAQAQPVEGVPIGAVAGASGTQPVLISIPNLPSSAVSPFALSSPIQLVLGYRDEPDAYNDDGYNDHDAGNNDQCAYNRDGGPAYLIIKIHHVINFDGSSTSPMPSVPAAPFDLVPHGFDSNFLFLNPTWGWQVGNAPVAAWQPGCNRISPSSVTQLTSYDGPNTVADLLLPAPFFLFGFLCDVGTTGHMNWFDVTYQGSVRWLSGPEWFDGDYNMLLDTPITSAGYDAGATINNPDYVKLEFNSRETIDHFLSTSSTQQWWSDFKLDVDRGLGSADIDGHDAVVIGLMGIDDMHDPHAEVHPVHVLAIRMDKPANPANDRWAIFARNWGDEGGCSSQQHFLDRTAITVALPALQNLSGFHGVPVVLPGSRFSTSGSIFNPHFSSVPDAAFITFPMASGDARPLVVGEIYLDWTRSGAVAVPTLSSAQVVSRVTQTLSTAPTTATPLASAPDDLANADPEELLGSIWAQVPPAQQALYNRLYDLLDPPAPEPEFHDATIQIDGSLPSRPLGVPTVSQAPNLVKQRHDVSQNRALCAAVGGRIPTQDTWCPLVNLPPVTLLNTSGGALGKNGWLVNPVTVALDANDAAASGIDRTEYSYDDSVWIRYTGNTRLPDGKFTFYYRSRDKRGNVEEVRQQPFAIDTVPPVVTYSGNLSSYTVDQTVNITCSATDVTSGVVSTTCKDIKGPAYSFKFGSNTFSATATDDAGNVGMASVTFMVRATYGSLCSLSRRFVTNDGMGTGMCTVLDAAALNEKLGVPDGKAGELRGYKQMVQASLQSKFLNTEQADILTRAADQL